MAAHSPSRKAPLADLDGVRLVALPVHDNDDKSRLTVIEEGAVPLKIRRVFAVRAVRAVRRGAHAHRRCNQFLVCLEGRVVVGLDDGRRHKRVVLAGPARGLFVPAGIWAEQDYSARSTLLVLCDRAYEASDYIRGYDRFLRFRGLAGKTRAGKKARAAP